MGSDSENAVVDLLSACLRGEAVTWPAASGLAEALVAAAERHGVQMLLASRLARQGWPCPPAFRSRLSADVRREALAEALVTRELRDVLAALASSGVPALLFKGAALAFTHYESSSHRPRIDTDILVRDGDVETVSRILRERGYQLRLFPKGDLLIYEDLYFKTDTSGVLHQIDVHWKASNPHLFAPLWRFEELDAHAERVPQLGEAARAFGPVQALAMACIHRVAHHHGRDRLIWFYDIHLIGTRFRPEEIDAFVPLVITKGICGIAIDALARAHTLFPAAPLADLLRRLESAAPRGEATSRYLRGGMTRVEMLLADLSALPAWSDRARLIRQNIFPPADYMKRLYGVSTSLFLPGLYAWRLIAGAARWLRRP